MFKRNRQNFYQITHWKIDGSTLKVNKSRAAEAERLVEYRMV